MMMENSASSSHYKGNTTSKPSLEIEEDSVVEESGWTQYIQDFEDGENSSSCYSYMSYSMVSDAGSGPEWKNKYSINPAGASDSFAVLQKLPKRLNFKKKIPFDDSLEDTASSPVNSPKITTYFKRMDINSSRKMDSDNGSPMGNEIPIEEHVEYNNNINRDDDFKNVDCIDLKQKGLCVVPVSMVVNYLG